MDHREPARLTAFIEVAFSEDLGLLRQCSLRLCGTYRMNASNLVIMSPSQGLVPRLGNSASRYQPTNHRGYAVNLLEWAG